MTDTVAPQSQPATYYTPERVWALLRKLPYLYDRLTPAQDGAPRPQRRTSPSSWLEEQTTKHADITWALAQLPSPTQEIVYLSHLEDLPVKEIAGVVELDERTVYRHRRDGIRYMAWLLGWRDPEQGYGPEHYAKVKRRIFGT